jgi:hypothetical protein
MADDGTIRMRLRSLPPGPIVEGEFTYNPGDRDYQKTIGHLGGLAPGAIKTCQTVVLIRKHRD